MPLGCRDAETFRLRNNWNPPLGRDPHLESFISAVRQDVQDFQAPKYVRDNLTKGERAALRNLRKDNSITIKPENKGPAFVIQNTTDYVSKAEKELSNLMPEIIRFRKL
ncbi:hypothetical protein HOLleu_31360 [Holothuria leucospilota]|uniref:Uncharacterized protein n=1 Tax=Holothuria leucospilota TaxID=206669 RepID=A0A9Q0YQ16_HOLLE|nr:hypothetical protein HOLleu_31360 [Holothuria leucospilota]